MRCTALIVTFNRLEKLKTTIEKTREIGFSTIVIVNNGSSDGTQEWLETLSKSDSDISVLTLPANIGGAGGFKIGSRFICDENKTDWIFFYDDDAYPQKDILRQFSPYSEGACKVFTSLVKDLNGNICSMNLPFAKLPVSLSDTLRYTITPERYLPPVDVLSKVQTVSFVGMIIHSNILKNNLEKIHDELFIYFDDVYFGYHLDLAGVEISFIPDITFIHDVSIQGKKISPEWKVYYLCRNMILSRRFFGREKAFCYAAIMIRLMKYIFILPYQDNKILYFKYLFRGVAHAFKGVTGKHH